MLSRRRLSVLGAAAIMMLAVLLASGAAMGITGGTVDGNKHPNVGALVDKDGTYCSGTLVDGKQSAKNPTGAPVFVTAAHCDYPGKVYVTFESSYKVTRAERVGWPEGGMKEYRGTLDDDGRWYVKGHDIAVVVFDAPDAELQNRPTAKLPTLGELADTAKGDKFTAVGYGDTSGSSNDYGTRRNAVSTFKSVDQTYLRLSQHNGSGGTCYGDSGGPNFVGEYPYDYDKNPTTPNVPVIAGLTITGDTWCKATNVTLRLDTVQAQNILAGLGVKTG